ncbi:MAG: polysaccharide biosynthesis tyrosine autokinase, partial [Elainellaceae cyanobacterium]
DEVSQQFLDYSFEQRQISLQQGIAFVDGRLPELRERVDSLQERLEQFRQQYNLLDPETRGGNLSELISSVEQQRQDLQTELVQARSLFQTLQAQLGTTPAEAIASATLSESSRYQSLLNQVKAVEAQIAVESARYQPDSPQIAALSNRRDNLLALLQDEADQTLNSRFSSSVADSNLTPTTLALNQQLIDVANQIETLQARSQSLAQVEQDLVQEFDLVPALAREYAELQNELSTATQSLNRFLETRELLQIDAAQKSVPWELISSPQTPSKAISPNLPRNLALGSVVGLLLGIASAVLMEKLDQVFHSTTDLKAMTRLPVIGTIPHVPNLHHRVAPSGAVSDPKGSHRVRFQAMMALEAFRSLYTSIRFLDSRSSVGSVVITSTIPGEGKSTVAAGLAQAAAAIGQRVLLVDADLRTPQQHIRAGLSNDCGLSSLVSDGADISAAIQQSAQDPNLFILTSGPRPPDAGKVLASQQMQTVMQLLHQTYDFVVYDTPPASGFADSSLIVSHVDGLLLTVGLGKTERVLVRQSIDKIRLLPNALVGIVANGVKPYTTQTRRYDGYYQHYQQAADAAAYSSAIRREADDAYAPPSTKSVGSSMEQLTPDSSSHITPAIASPLASAKHKPTVQKISIPEQTPLGWKWFAAVAGGLVLLGTVSAVAVSRILNGPTANNTASDQPELTDNVEEGISEAPSANAATTPSRPRREATNTETAVGESSADKLPVSDTSGLAAFEEAVQVAQQAVTVGGKAQTPPEWSQTAELWQRASALMSSVPETEPRFDVARDRVVLYRGNSEYARQQALSLQLSKEP